ncbi:hypothetical protein [Brazilian marseillevirus]|uniref:hypothetical protein n=1 Tax=Brazilian marseillevirus TaxID=1813599 RepID=UPI000782E653|nr:hypothetical protein A3303_gp340 [Brazilian marseillevirus]AMQ10848.1 hypothetical protein [Brazilian marseillevirus]
MGEVVKRVGSTLFFLEPSASLFLSLLESFYGFSFERNKKMQRIKKFPREWKKVFHCTRHWNYSQKGSVRVEHRTSPLVKNSVWDDFIVYDESKHFGVTKPEHIFETPWGSLLCKFRDIEHWFLFEGESIEGNCSTCDGDTTESSYTVTEFLCLHDFFYYGLDDPEREKIVDIDFLLSLELETWESFEDYQDFRKNVSRSKLKKVLFFLDGRMDE